MPTIPQVFIGKDAVPVRPFRTSEFIDFNTGTVLIPPMSLMLRSLDPAPFELKLRRFACRTDVWFFGPAVEVLKHMEARPEDSISIWAHSGFSLLGMTAAYFEMAGKILHNASRHQGTSKADFVVGFKDVYPTFDGSDKDIKSFYDRVRNGLFHLTFTKKKLWIHHQPHNWPEDFCVRMEEGALRYLVNPHHMTRTVVNHFPGLVARIESGELQQKFLDFYDNFFNASDIQQA